MMQHTPTALRRRLLRVFFGISRAKPDLYNQLMFYQVPGLRKIKARELS